MPWVTIRCPRCGAYVAAEATGVATAWATCPHCYTTLPIVAPRDPPPLFSWEVYPSAYPPLPAPRAPGAHLPTAVFGTLVAAAVLMAGLAGVLFLTGSSALAPATFGLHGEVLAAGPAGGATGPPVAGAVVTLTSETGFHATVATGADGTFDFTGIPVGAATLNVTATGFGSSQFSLFFSTPYTAAGDPGGLTVELSSSPGAGTTVSESAFSSLEDLVTSLWSGTALFGIAASISAAGAVFAWRRRRAAVVVAGGAAALVAPAAMFLLGDALVLPTAAYVTAGLSALGAVAAVLGSVPLWWEGAPPEPIEPL